MKPIRIAAAILLLSASFLLDVQVLSGQTAYFPLQKGNVWEIAPSRKIVALGDTLFSNGHHYSRLYNSYDWYSSWWRTSGDTLFRGWDRESVPDTEEVWFRFNVHAGDSIRVQWIDSVHWQAMVVTAIDTVTIFSRTLRRWQFRSTSNFLIDADVDWWVIDSLGIMAMESFWDRYTVAGAVIDGVTYGTVTPEGTFPLHTGNLWQYMEFDSSQTPLEYRAAGDSLLPNGKRYQRLMYRPGSWPTYLRQEGNRVYEWVASPDSNVFVSYEHLRYDFSKIAGDTIRVEVSKGTTDTIWTVLQSTGIGMVFGKTRKLWGFYTHDNFTSMYSYETIADSVGMTYWGYEPGIRLYLRGAIIGGVTHGVVTGVHEPSLQDNLPRSYGLSQNYPNPFNPSTTIRYTLPHRSHVRLVVFNVLGQEVARLVDGDVGAGVHDVVFDARHLASDAYLYRITAGDFTQTRMLVLVR